MPEQLQVELRQSHGKRRNRRLRGTGRTPAVLYGHGQENLSLSVSSEELEPLVRQGARLLSLTGAVNESAFVREVQWDTWGNHVLHMDLARISLDEAVEIEVTIGLRGEAPGVRAGGVVDLLVHHLRISCPAGAIPEKLWININNLKLEEEILAGAVELPQGATLLDDPEAVVVLCKVPAEAPEEEAAGEAGPAEPEVIGAKKKEEGEEEE